jgi:hypothetical protein
MLDYCPNNCSYPLNRLWRSLRTPFNGAHLPPPLPWACRLHSTMHAPALPGPSTPFILSLRIIITSMCCTIRLPTVLRDHSPGPRTHDIAANLFNRGTADVSVPCRPSLRSSPHSIRYLSIPIPHYVVYRQERGPPPPHTHTCFLHLPSWLSLSIRIIPPAPVVPLLTSATLLFHRHVSRSDLLSCFAGDHRCRSHTPTYTPTGQRHGAISTPDSSPRHKLDLASGHKSMAAASKT